MFVVQAMAPTVYAAPIVMPLLTELGYTTHDVCYRHGAPSGAVPDLGKWVSDGGHAAGSAFFPLALPSHFANLALARLTPGAPGQTERF